MNFPVLRPFQESAVPWSTSLLTLRSLGSQGPTIETRKVPSARRSWCPSSPFPSAGAERGPIRHQLESVGHERVVVAVGLGRPQAVETAIGSEPGQPGLLVPHARVGAVLPAVAG